MSSMQQPSGWNRRELLAAAGALMVGPLSKLSRAEQTAGRDSTFDCIVLGAGIAGVTAARDLHRAGYRVLLVEGADRIGGRVLTLRDFVRHPKYAAETAHFPVEAGAEFVHVGDAARYPEFLAELDLDGFSRRKYPKFKRNRLAFPEWKHNPKKLVFALLQATNLIPTVALLGDVDDYDRAEDMPAGEYLGTKAYQGKGIRLARYTLSSHTPGQLYDPSVDLFEPDTFASRAALSDRVIDTISVAGLKADQLPRQLFYEKSEFRLEQSNGQGGAEIAGYDRLPEEIVKQFLDQSQNPSGTKGELLLGHRVTQVRRRVDGIAVTTVANGERREILARSAICTFSVGMLEPATGLGEEIFGELLTEAKRDALRGIRMGAITKLGLEFKKSFWGRKTQMTVMSSPKSCARTFFSCFPDHRKGPFVLSALLMNQDHEIVRGLDDEAAVQHVLDVLQSLLAPRSPRWTPESVLTAREPGRPNYYRQDWARDEFAKGGNSYLAYDASRDSSAVSGLRRTLRDPRETLPLFWAGEATAPAYHTSYQPLSVHGAYISGVGAAKDVEEYLMSHAAESFRNAYEAKQTTTLVALSDPGSRTPLHLAVSQADREKLSRYAAERTGGDLKLAAKELCRIGLYLQEHDPKTLRAKKPLAVERIELVPTEVERKRIDDYASRYFSGDSEQALLALLRRGLQASSQAPSSEQD